MKYLLIIIAIFLVKTSLGQPGRKEVFRLENKATKFVRLTVFNVSSATVLGYDGQDIVLEALLREKRSFGNLREINPKVNSEQQAPLPPKIAEENNSISVVFKGDHRFKYLLKVPRNLHLSFTQQVTDREGDLTIRSLSNEIEVRTDASLVKIDSLSGPLILTAKSMSSNPKKIIISNLIQKTTVASGGSINILTVNHDIEMNLGRQLQASFNISALKGDIYSDLHLNPSVSFVPGNYVGQFNQGAVPISIRTEYGNVYLKKSQPRLESR